jgi:hypothetical protein
MRIFGIAAAIALCAGSAPAVAKAYLDGAWGGEHVGLVLEGGLGTVEYDCASGTIDGLILPAKDGRFTINGTYRTGPAGPVRVGQIFRATRATYSGTVKKQDKVRTMTLNVKLEDGTLLGPFTLTQGAQPQIMRCLERG